MFYLTALLSILIKYHNLYLLGYVEKQGFVYVLIPPLKNIKELLREDFAKQKQSVN